MVQTVVVITCVVVVQLVGHETVMVVSSVMVPMTYKEVNVVQDCCWSSTPLLLWACVYG
jgi:hypothetical protein